MSLISLLIALLAERYLSSTIWQFNTFYQRYQSIFKHLPSLRDYKNTPLFYYGYIFFPPLLCYLLLSQINNALLYLIASTLILIICFGCIKTRECYKQYLESAFKGELTTCQLYCTQLNQEKNIDLNFGQSLIWLNYRYFIAVMLFFVIFGPAGALFYRLLVTVNENSYRDIDSDKQSKDQAMTEVDQTEELTNTIDPPEKQTSDNTNNSIFSQLLFWCDIIPVRLVAFGYMLVGHFSKAMPIWLENLFDVNKKPCEILISVAQYSEDFMIDEDDCTSEPCLLVKLAKRTLLLFLCIISILILSGTIN